MTRTMERQQNQKLKESGIKCTVPYCMKRQLLHEDKCKLHGARTPIDFARALPFNLRCLILDVPFNGWYSTYFDDHPLNAFIDYTGLNSLEEIGLIEPSAMPSQERGVTRWGYSLTDIGKRTVVCIRSTTGRSKGPYSYGEHSEASERLQESRTSAYS